jgi:uncharacterized membrane protein YoaK (UPF0700 family)
VSTPAARPPLWRDYVAHPNDGPLPALLLLLTVLTGVIDAVSILALGRVFVANMTGNVVFTGFALAGAAGFSLGSSLAALAGFLVGAFAGGAFVARSGGHRGLLLGRATVVQLLFVGIALIVALSSDVPFATEQQIALSALCALAMGLQNSVVRKLAVPDLTTTVLTMTLTGIAADVRSSGWSVVVRRVLAVLTMLLGAIIGTVLVLHADVRWALGLVVAILAVVGASSFALSRNPAPWNSAR